MVRPKGTDGSDYESRMLVEERYKKTVETRGKLRTSLYLLTIYHLARVIWEILPWHEGVSEAEMTKFVLVLGILSIVLGYVALKSRKRYLLKLFTVVLTIITVGEVLDAIVSRQNRHLMMAHRDGFVRLIHKMLPGADGGFLSTIGDMIEGILAMGGILIHGTTIHLTNQLLSSTTLKQD